MKTKKPAGAKSQSVVTYMRAATFEQMHINGELSAERQSDEIKIFAQAQGIMHLAESGVPQIGESVQKGQR